MKKFKKFLIPIIILILIIIVLFIIVKSKQTNSNIIENSNNTSSINSENNIDDKYKSNFNGENAVIYLGTHSQYEPFTIILDKSLSNEELSKSIIYKISELISYKIELNNIEFKDKNIYIDFSKDYAPFNIEESFIQSENKLYSIYGKDNLVYTIFNSIYKSLTSYFGTDYNIYFSCDLQNINISIDDFNFSIDSNTPYTLSE